MEYTTDEFLTLLVRVEDQGGSLLDDEHEREGYIREFTGDEIIGAELKFDNCGGAYQFEVPYELPRGDVLGKITVCGVDDNVGQWPRFAHPVEVEE